MSYQAVDPKVRFAAKYAVNERTGCWEWSAAKKPKGYGNFMLRKVDGHGEFESAHRASWLIHKGPIPEGLCVLHRCDNPMCVNPEHLFLGTNKDNTDDMLQKGRGSLMANGGEAHPNSTLSDDVVSRMRAERVAGAKLKELAERYGCSEGQASRICARKSRRKGGDPT